jgi:hypothetical protein
MFSYWIIQIKKQQNTPCIFYTLIHCEEVLLRVSEQRNILHEIRKRKANRIGHILRRNCLLKQVIEGKIQGQKEVTRRRGRRRKSCWMTLGTEEVTLI